MVFLFGKFQQIKEPINITRQSDQRIYKFD